MEAKTKAQRTVVMMDSHWLFVVALNCCAILQAPCIHFLATVFEDYEAKLQSHRDQEELARSLLLARLQRLQVCIISISVKKSKSSL